MNPYTYTFSFRAVHPTEKLDKFIGYISSLNGFSLGTKWDVGNDRRDKKGNALGGKYRESYCVFKFFDKWRSSDIEDLSIALENVVNQLISLKPQITEFIANGGKLDFFIGLSINANSGIELDRDLLGKLSVLGISLGFDIYPSDTNG